MKYFFRGLCLVVVILFIPSIIVAQKAKDLEFTNVKEGVKSNIIEIIGKGFNNNSDELFYSRLPIEMKGKVRDAVWDLGRNSSGIAIRFSSNATVIGAKWKLLNNFGMAHMAATGVRGLDLYMYDNGEWAYVGTAQPNGKESINIFRRSMKEGYKDFLLYLPLYDGVVDLEIGVEKGAKINAPISKALRSWSDKKPIVFYGTSVTQGGCASRPGMTYTSIVERKVDRECINLGFSGNGRMDGVMADYISKIDAAAFVIDCLANCTYQIIKDSTEYFIRTIAKAHPHTPIYMVSNYAYPYQFIDDKFREDLANENSLWLAMCNKFREEGLTNIWFVNFSGSKVYPQVGETKIKEDSIYKKRQKDGLVRCGAIGPDGEATVDGVHLTDLGFLRMAGEYIKILKRL